MNSGKIGIIMKFLNYTRKWSWPGISDTEDSSGWVMRWWRMKGCPRKQWKDTQKGEDQLKSTEGNGWMQWAGMLSGCWNAGTGKGWQRIEIPGGGGLKRPRPKSWCSATEEENSEEWLWWSNKCIYSVSEPTEHASSVVMCVIEVGATTNIVSCYHFAVVQLRSLLPWQVVCQWVISAWCLKRVLWSHLQGVKMDFPEELEHHYRIWSKPQHPWNSGDVYALNGGFTRLRTKVPHVNDFIHSNSSQWSDPTAGVHLFGCRNITGMYQEYEERLMVNTWNSIYHIMEAWWIYTDGRQDSTVSIADRTALSAWQTEQHCQYINLPQAGWSRVQILVNARFSVPVCQAPRPTLLPVQWALHLLPGGTVARSQC